jgi:hypothetical protein
MSSKQKTKKLQKGRGIDQSNLLPGELHGVIQKADGTYSRANFMGPNTNLGTRIPRKDKGLSYIDNVSKKHDLAYSLAKTPADVRKADLDFLSKVDKAEKNNLDSQFNLTQAKLIKAKVLAENIGVPPSWIASYGGAPEQLKQLFEDEKNLLTMQGYGKKKPRKQPAKRKTKK